jgi:TPR repeat protein
MKRALLPVLLACSMTAFAGNYEDGLAAQKRGDLVTAVKRFRLAAQQGNASAQFSLGAMYYFGTGVSKDFTEAAKWYRLAAQQGDKNAQNNLGFLYLDGRGVAQDYVRAHMWFNLAATGGDSVSVDGRNAAASKMTPEKIAEAQRMARECQARKFKNCD